MILKLDQLSKSYPSGSNPEGIRVLNGLNLEIEKGQTVAIVGQSGCGKSTLLSLIAGLDNPTRGEVILEGQSLTLMDERSLGRFRAQRIGVVFQKFHLMPHLTALENISLPLELSRSFNALERAQELLDQVGLSHRANHFPHQLSGGECQRVAIARALVISPSLLLADEPTGNLDEKTGDHLADILFGLVETIGMTLLLVTHNQQLAAKCSRTWLLQDGTLH